MKTFKSKVDEDFRVKLPDDFKWAYTVIVRFDGKSKVYEGKIDYSKPVMYCINREFMYFRSESEENIPIKEMSVEIDYQEVTKEDIIIYMKTNGLL